MSTDLTSKGSMRLDNRFRFHCPTIGADQFFLACLLRRAKHYRNEVIDRPECRLCMRAGKCAAERMLKLEWARQETLFFDPSPAVLHRVPSKILEHLERIMVVRSQAAGLDVSSEMLERIVDKQSMSAPQTASAPTTPRVIRGKAQAPRTRGEGTGDVIPHIRSDMAELLTASVADATDR